MTKENYYENRVVAFIDILGFREHVNLNGLLEVDEDHQIFVDYMDPLILKH